ncbi:MAG TPA: sulfatase-like hydrolase/transferase [Spirochaetia bacterium]|nr:sulfatase-like hydrolase/transferase [Spirochaetia bacterium]
MHDEPYSILLITSDHHRGDSLGLLDHPVAFTPHLDKLGQQGIVFRRAYSECPMCIPARMSIMTGLGPGTTEDSIGYNYYEECSPLLRSQTLPGLLGEAGYQTQAVGKMHFFPQRMRYGFDDMIIDEEGRLLPGLVRDDYETWLLYNGFAGENFGHGVTSNENSCRIWHLPERAHSTNWTARETCRWFNRMEPDTPFFLWMSFSAPHPPYTPPLPYWELFRNISVPPRIEGNWTVPEQMPAVFIRSQFPHNSDRLTQFWYNKSVRAYYALIAQIDFQISLVIGMLREKGLLGRTIILYTADHGDMMGDFNTFEKRLFYDGSANIPFILALPEGHPDYRYGEISHNPVGLQDVLPTLLDAAGVEPPRNITGVSALAGLRDRRLSRPLIHGNYSNGKDTPDASHMITDGHMKYIWYNEGNIQHLFDLERDPREKVNLAQEPRNDSLVLEWRERLIEILEDERSPDVRDGGLVSIPYPELHGPHLRSHNVFNQRGMHF